MWNLGYVESGVVDEATSPTRLTRVRTRCLVHSADLRQDSLPRPLRLTLSFIPDKPLGLLHRDSLACFDAVIDRFDCQQISQPFFARYTALAIF